MGIVLTAVCVLRRIATQLVSNHHRVPLFSHHSLEESFPIIGKHNEITTLSPANVPYRCHPATSQGSLSIVGALSMRYSPTSASLPFAEIIVDNGSYAHAPQATSISLLYYSPLGK